MRKVTKDRDKMTLGFYIDTHISKQVALQLRLLEITVVRCEDVGLAEATDEEHLDYAATHGLVLVTKDADFLRLHAIWRSKNISHAGIMFCPERSHPAIGRIVSACRDYHDLIRRRQS